MDISSAFAFVENGFTCLEEVAYVPFDELTAIAGMSGSSLHVATACVQGTGEVRT